MKKKKIILRILLYFVVILIVVWTITPYLWLIISSISYKIDLTTVPLKWIPRRLTLENYQGLFFHRGESSFSADVFVDSLKNSAIVSISTMLLSMPVGVLAAYASTRLKFKGNSVVMITSLVAQLIPPIILVIPLFVILRQFNLIDKTIGLILVHISIALPLIIWLMRGYFATIPYDLEDAARIDGCSRLGALVRIILPLTGPGLVSVMIFAFIASWNEYLYAYVLTRSEARTVPVIIGEFSTKLGLDYLQIAAAGVLASLPPVILALIFQKFIIKGLTGGAVK
jgi:multiple sugar transport system permease protein